MKTKCEFCGGETENAYVDLSNRKLCRFCSNCVPAFLVNKNDDMEGEYYLNAFWGNVSTFIKKEDAQNLPLSAKVVYELCSTKADRIKDLEKQRHELEAKVVDLTNENFKLKDDLQKAQVADAKLTSQLSFNREKAIQAIEVALWGNSCSDVSKIATKAVDAIISSTKAWTGYATDKLVIENNQLKEGLARCQVDNDRLRKELDDLNKFLDKAEVGAGVFFKQEEAKFEAVKQQRNDWEKLAGEYRFKAEKLADKVKELEKENGDLLDENAKLQEENEDLDGEAEQYFQTVKRLNAELAPFKFPIPNYYRYLNLRYPVKYLNIDFSKL